MTDPSVEVPDPSQVHSVGTAAIIHRVMRADDGTLTVFIQGLGSFRVLEWTAEEPYLRARIEMAPDVVESRLWRKRCAATFWISPPGWPSSSPSSLMRLFASFSS